MEWPPLLHTHTGGGEDNQVSETVASISCTQREMGEAGETPLPMHPKLPPPPLPVYHMLPLPPLPTCAAQAASLAALPTGPVPSRLSASSTSKGTSSATCRWGSSRYCLGEWGGYHCGTAWATRKEGQVQLCPVGSGQQNEGGIHGGTEDGLHVGCLPWSTADKPPPSLLGRYVAARHETAPSLPSMLSSAARQLSPDPARQGYGLESMLPHFSAEPALT